MAKIKHFDAINKIVGCRVSDIPKNLSPKMKNGFIQQKADEVLIEQSSSWNDFIKGLKYPLTDLPLDIYKGIAKHIDKDLLKSDLLISHDNKKLQDSQERILRGLYEHGDRFIEEAFEEAKKKGLKISTDPKDGEAFKLLCDKVTDKYYELLNKGLDGDKAQYNTKTERTQVRLISGGVAAFALYIDFYNKNIRDGAKHNEADKLAKIKLKQELIATAGEAEVQYLTLSGFQKYANNSQFGAPIINTVIGLFLHIASRLYTDQPLTRIKPSAATPPKINYFDLANNRKTPDKPKDEPPPDKDKGRILTLKNIGIACLISVSGGFAIRYGKTTLSNSRLLDNLRGLFPIKKGIEYFQKLKDNYNKSVIGELWINQDEGVEFLTSLKKTKNNKAFNYYNGKLDSLVNTESEGKRLFLGQYKKTIKIPFTDIHLLKNELIKLPLIPFKLITEIASYPYKAAEKIFEQAGLIKKLEKKKNKLQDPLNMVNVIRDYQKNLKRFDKKEDFNKFYENHLNEIFENSVNCETKSGIDNAKIGKLTQILGTFMSIYFATTDDFNRTMQKTGNEKQAQADARERGINKFLRIVSQIAILDALMGVCKFAYAKSLPCVCAITLACTTLTDIVSRVLSGMPYIRVNNKAEFDKYTNYKKNNGISGTYFRLIDKLKQ